MTDLWVLDIGFDGVVELSSFLEGVHFGGVGGEGGSPQGRGGSAHDEGGRVSCGGCPEGEGEGEEQSEQVGQGDASAGETPHQVSGCTHRPRSLIAHPHTTETHKHSLSTSNHLLNITIIIQSNISDVLR